MPRRNRVTPFGDIIATEARGLLFGNRGVLHDEHGQLIRAWQVRRWIACQLVFKGRRRELLRPGRFTELFFLDEATALAAGHRPCAECRRQDYLRFREAWSDNNPGGPPKADDMDRVLHAERIGPGDGKRMHQARLADLPDGSMVAEDDRAWIVMGGDLLRWSPFGYGTRRAKPGSTRVWALTPPPVIGVLRAGYEPGIHPTGQGDTYDSALFAPGRLGEPSWGNTRRDEGDSVTVCQLGVHQPEWVAGAGGEGSKGGWGWKSRETRSAGPRDGEATRSSIDWGPSRSGAVGSCSWSGCWCSSP